MTAHRHRWIGALVLTLGCLLLTRTTGAQDKKDTEEKAKEESPLEKKARKLLEGTLDDKKQLIGEVRKHLQEKGNKIGVAEARLAFGIASALEQLEVRELAAEAFTQFGKELAASDNKDIAGFSKLLQGAGRRLGSLGKEIDIKGKSIEGKDIDLASYKKKVVLVDFWATWCGPCVAELPNIKKMYQKYRDKGFEVIGVSVDEDKEALEKFLKKEEILWSTIFDHAAKDGQRLSEQYGVLGIPQAILVNRDGKVVALEARGPELERMLGELLK